MSVKFRQKITTLALKLNLIISSGKKFLFADTDKGFGSFYNLGCNFISLGHYDGVCNGI